MPIGQASRLPGTGTVNTDPDAASSPLQTCGQMLQRRLPAPAQRGWVASLKFPTVRGDEPRQDTGRRFREGSLQSPCSAPSVPPVQRSLCASWLLSPESVLLPETKWGRQSLELR